MHPNAQLITRFYEGFARRDAGALATCYHKDIEFSDPVSPDLKGDQAGDMWRMLVARATDLAMRFNVKAAGERRGTAGVLLGWTPFIRNQVRKQAAEGLEAFRRNAGRT